MKKRPLAYITAHWSDNEYENTERAAKFCRAVYDAGFSPICPLLIHSLFLRDEVPQEHKDGLDMARDYLRRSTGKNGGSASDIKDGYAHTGTASAGDVLDYQIISTLPTITSESTYLSCYTFVDTLSKGLTYTKGDVVLEFFTDAACTDKVASWKETDGKFSVAYNTSSAGEGVMTVEMTEEGLAEINTSKAVYADASMVNTGYSDCTVRITYTAKMDSDNSVVFGDIGNDNKVVLTWKRTSDNYYDTLVDDAHVFTYGIDLTKKFSDGSKGEKIVHTVTPVLGQKAAHNGKVVYSLDFPVTPHQLRHTYITNLIHKSVDPKTVQYLAGHENSKITMDIYAKVKYNKPEELADVVTSAFS